MTLGRRLHYPDRPDAGMRYCEAVLPPGSIYRWLARERDRLFGDGLFADLYTGRGRRSVPPSVVAVVTVLQRLEGLSDREAADRFAFDVRWRYAAGVGDPLAGAELAGFAHTVLVDLRARLRASADPDRIFRVTCELARAAGLVGVRRVLDSAPLLDAVATQDTVTLVRSAIRGLGRAVPPPLAGRVRGALARDDDYTAPGKPACAWDDPDDRARLVDALFGDGYRALGALAGAELDARAAEAAELLATVVGQDIEETSDGTFRIATGVAVDRVISTVDVDARHGHKTAARGFDGYKGHAAIDPDSEVITAAVAGPANTGDAEVAAELLAWLADHDITPMVKAPTPTSAPGGRFGKQRFAIDLAARTVTCPASPPSGWAGPVAAGRPSPPDPPSAPATSPHPSSTSPDRHILVKKHRPPSLCTGYVRSMLHFGASYDQAHTRASEHHRVLRRYDRPCHPAADAPR